MTYPAGTARLGARRAIIVAVTALLAVALASNPPASAHHRPGHPGGPPPAEPSPTEFALIQPGASPGGAVGGCVLNFVFRDPAGQLYIGIAGHCVGDSTTPATGQAVQDVNGDRFGEVVFHHPSMRTNAIDMDGINNAVADVVDDGSLDVDDFALIAIDEDRYGDVSPMVRHFGGPSGVADPRDPELGDMVAMYGQTTLGFAVTQVDPDLAGANPVAARIGPLRRLDDRRFGADVPIVANDSGSPVIDAATGEAIGIVTAWVGTAESPTVADGPTVGRALELAAHAGFRLELVTAPFPPGG